MSGRIRVLLAKVGLEGSDRGEKAVARALRDAGMDVIYAGPGQTPDQVINAAIQEDVDILGLSLASFGDAALFSGIFARLRLGGTEDMIVVASGPMADHDAEALKKLGVKEVMPESTPPPAMVDILRRLVAERGPR